MNEELIYIWTPKSLIDNQSRRPRCGVSPSDFVHEHLAKFITNNTYTQTYDHVVFSSISVLMSL